MATLFFGLAGPARAEGETELGSLSNLSVHGFGTLGVARSSSADAEFVRDLSQTRGIKDHWSGLIDTNFGVQTNWRASDSLELVGQVVSRYHYDQTRNPEVMWAFAKWTPNASVALRAGRIGADFMMLADSRLVGYSYLTARPSSDYFGPLFFSHFDGIDSTLTLPIASGIVKGKVFYGVSHEKAAGTPGIWDTTGSPVKGMVVDYLEGAWQFRASATSIRPTNDINFSPLTESLRAVGATYGYPGALAAADALSTRDKTAWFYTVGAVYDNGPLQIQGMLNRVTQETEVFQNSYAGYLLAGYRMGSVTPFAGISWWKSKYKDNSTGLPAGAGFDSLNAAFENVMRASTADQKTYTLGIRWDFMKNTDLKIQWDGIHGTPGSRFPYAQSNAEWNGRMNVLSLSLDFVF